MKDLLFIFSIIIVVGIIVVIVVFIVTLITKKLVYERLIWRKYPFVFKNVLLDPSLFLDYEKSKKVFHFIREWHKEFNFFISRSFYEFLEVLKYGPPNKWYKIAQFFEWDREMDPYIILEILNKHRKYFRFFEIPKRIYRKKYIYFYKNMSRDIEDRKLVKILFEEWVFLQEFSWIVAKSKSVFEEFKKAGATVIEISKNAWDEILEKLARYKLNKRDNEFLSTVEKLRGLGKWIAHGGITVAGATLPNPIIGVLVSYLIGEGIFVLIDPETLIRGFYDSDGV